MLCGAYAWNSKMQPQGSFLFSMEKNVKNNNRQITASQKRLLQDNPGPGNK